MGAFVAERFAKGFPHDWLVLTDLVARCAKRNAPRLEAIVRVLARR